jgi:hypothetical protein
MISGFSMTERLAENADYQAHHNRCTLRAAYSKNRSLS